MTDAQQAIAQVREALAAGPTPGPWRWEVSAHGKRLQLVGGLRPQYDLTVMGFTRWGMSGATIKLRDLARDGLDLLYRLHERADWIAPIPGREHHANWCSTVTHPDAAFIAKCNPENIAAILAHVEAQAAEIERLRDLLRVEQALALRQDPFRCYDIECEWFGRPVRAGDCQCHHLQATTHRANVRDALADRSSDE